MALPLFTFFAQGSFYSNAMFVTGSAVPDGVVIAFHVPRLMLRPFGIPPRLTIRRDDVEQVYRCGKVLGGRALLVMRPETGLPPTMVSWRVVEQLRPSAPVTRKGTGWCFQRLKGREQL